jgi:hypothetical protein
MPALEHIETGIFHPAVILGILHGRLSLLVLL